MTNQLPVAFTYPADFFNIRDTLECGQVFRYKQLDDGAYAVYSQDKYAELRYNAEGCVEVRTEHRDYFGTISIWTRITAQRWTRFPQYRP